MIMKKYMKNQTSVGSMNIFKRKIVCSQVCILYMDLLFVSQCNYVQASKIMTIKAFLHRSRGNIMHHYSFYWFRLFFSRNLLGNDFNDPVNLSCVINLKQGTGSEGYTIDSVDLELGLNFIAVNSVKLLSYDF